MNPSKNRSPGPRTRILSLAVVLGCLALHPAGVRGEPVFDAPTPGSVELADTPIEVETVGLTLRAPVGATSSVQSISGVSTVSIRLPGENGVVSIQPRRTDRELTLTEIERTLIVQILGLPEETTGVTIETQIETSKGELLGRSPVVVAADRLMRPFYVRLKELGEGSYRGAAVLPVTRTDYVLFNLYAPPDEFERARVMFETMLASVETGQAASVDERRGEAVRAGVALFERLGPDDLEAVIRDLPREQFERIYQPAPGGAERDEREVGYRRVQAWVGDQADLERGEPGGGTSSPGYVLRIDGLVLLEDGRRADSRSVYFLSRDRSREAWSVRMAIRDLQGGKPEVWSEIGARIGDSMSVQIDKGGKSIETIRPAIEGDGYISRLESYLLGPLLVHAGEPGRYAFYSYDQSAESNRIREVELERMPERPGLWRVTTTRADGQAETAEFNEYGRLVRSETTEGLIKRPIEFQRLYSIWESKGLPLD